VYTKDFDTLLLSFDPSHQRTIREHRISSWHSVMPLERSRFDLSAQEFRDGLALRYRKPLLCYLLAVMDVTLPLVSSTCLIVVLVDLLVEGIIKRDAFGDLASLLWYLTAGKTQLV